jgi:membrane-associated protease RseP (regulator of RpoE activity)
MLLYKTKVGIKFIKWLSKKLSPIMPTLAVLSIICGSFLLLSIIALLLFNLWVMLTFPIDVFPILPVLPYVPQALDVGLPNFYFIHWILALLLVATTHEAGHGVFAAFYKIKIKATGFGFLGPILTAFVEPDEKVVQKRNAKQQLSIFAAGTFSNFVFGLFFILVLQLFFLAAYTPAGVGNYGFMYSSLNLTEVDSIGNYAPEDFLSLSDEELSSFEETLTVTSKDKNYYITPLLLKEIVKNRELIEKNQIIVAFDDTPAFRADLSGGIQNIGGNEISKMEHIREALSEYKPGDEVLVTTSERTYEITLAENPADPSRAYLGISFVVMPTIFSGVFAPYFNPYIHTEPNFNEQVIDFISGFIFWLILIFIGVALFNMLPFGFLDGGRFIFVSAFALTKSRKKAMRIFKFFSFLVLLILFLMVFIWAIL